MPPPSKGKGSLAGSRGWDQEMARRRTGGADGDAKDTRGRRGPGNGLALSVTRVDGPEFGALEIETLSSESIRGRTDPTGQDFGG